MSRSLGFVEQKIDESVIYWYACSGLEAELSNNNEGIFGSARAHELFFDYDFVYNKRQGLKESLRIAEKRIAERVSNAIIDCQRDLEEDKRNLQREEKIVALISTPEDIIDNRGEDKCTSSIEVGNGQECKPIRGAMQFYSHCDSCIFPASNILSTMQRVLKDGIFEDEGTPIQVKFIGDRLVVSETLTILIDQLSGIIGDRFNPDSTELSQQRLSRSNNFVIGGFINVFLVMVLLATWRKRKKIQNPFVKKLKETNERTFTANRQSIYIKGLSGMDKLELYATDNDDMGFDCKEEGIEIEIIPR